MANPFFRFKRFTVWQHEAGMKVSTDACIQGAWLSSKIKNVVDGACLLDIGAGTGLLTFMLLTEHTDLMAYCIEPNLKALVDLLQNIRENNLSERIKVQCTTIQSFESSSPFETIICNPPFFENQLQAPGTERNIARHDVQLSKVDLATHIYRLLHDYGQACVMYPQSEWNKWIDTSMQYGLYLQQQLNIQPRADKPINRVVGIFKKKPTSKPIIEHLCIYNPDHSYTPEFTALMRPFYLAL